MRSQLGQNRSTHTPFVKCKTLKLKLKHNTILTWLGVTSTKESSLLRLSARSVTSTATVFSAVVPLMWNKAVSACSTAAPLLLLKPEALPPIVRRKDD